MLNLDWPASETSLGGIGSGHGGECAEKGGNWVGGANQYGSATYLYGLLSSPSSSSIVYIPSSLKGYFELRQQLQTSGGEFQIWKERERLSILTSVRHGLMNKSQLFFIFIFTGA